MTTLTLNQQQSADLWEALEDWLSVAEDDDTVPPGMRGFHNRWVTSVRHIFAQIPNPNDDGPRWANHQDEVATIDREIAIQDVMRATRQSHTCSGCSGVGQDPEEWDDESRCPAVLIRVGIAAIPVADVEKVGLEGTVRCALGVQHGGNHEAIDGEEWGAV